MVLNGTTETFEPVLLTAITSAVRAVTTAVFITVTVILVSGKARIKRELDKARYDVKMKDVPAFEKWTLIRYLQQSLTQVRMLLMVITPLNFDC